MMSRPIAALIVISTAAIVLALIVMLAPEAVRRTLGGADNVRHQLIAAVPTRQSAHMAMALERAKLRISVIRPPMPLYDIVARRVTWEDYDNLSCSFRRMTLGGGLAFDPQEFWLVAFRVEGDLEYSSFTEDSAPPVFTRPPRPPTPTSTSTPAGLPTPRFSATPIIYVSEGYMLLGDADLDEPVMEGMLVYLADCSFDRISQLPGDPTPSPHPLGP
jgi:hypothetical protein